MALASVLVAFLMASAAEAELPRPRIALVPFENVTRASAARATVMETVQATLLRKGYEVVSGDAVEEFLRGRRIRYLDSVATDRIGELLAEVGADACLTGTILAWDAGGADPAVALAARVVARDGTLLWTDARGLTGNATEGALGLDRAPHVRAVADRLVAELLAGLPDRHLERVRPGGRKWWSGWGGPRVFRARTGGAPSAVAVLPLQNLTEARDAPRIVEAVLQHRLGERPDLQVVGPADLRGAVVRSALRAPSLLSVEQLRELAKEVGTRHFLRGAILAWGPSAADPRVPEVELYLSLLDAETGRTVWSGLHRRDGRAYEGLLRRGAIEEETSLASRVVEELLDAFTRP